MGKGIGTDSTISSMGTGALSLGHDKIVSTVPTECLLLKDNFSGVFGAPLASPRVCMPGPGQLILDQTDGQFSIVGGEFVWPAQGTPAWGDQDWHALKNDGDEYDVFDDLVLKFRGAWLGEEQLEGMCWFGFNLDVTPGVIANAEHAFSRVGFPVSSLRCTSGASDIALDLRDSWPAVDEYFQTAIVIRPYTAAGLHWYPDAPGVHTHGAHFFFKDESGVDSWRLVWYRQLQSRTDPIYPAFSNYDTEGKFDYVRMPCYDEDIVYPLLTPITWDEFIDNNGTLLPVHAITYGPTWSWVSDMGIWIITGNKADPNAANPAMATIHTLTPDVWVEVAVDAIAEWIGLTLRKSADTSGGTNQWMLYIKTAVDGLDTYLTEFNDGAQTHRVTADNDWAAQARNIRVRADDEEITLYVDYAEELHYALAWFNKHATWHGLYAQGYDAARFDNFIILPRGTGLTRICYDDFTHINGTSLDATTTEEGALAWDECVGDWDIQANEANPDGTADSHAHVVTTVSDVWVCARELNQIAYGGVLMRGSTATDYWYYAIRDATGTDSKLVEVDGGIQTVRSSTDTDAFAAGTRYYLEVSCEGQDINCYTDGTLRETFGIASFNETAVWHGLYANNAIRHDQFRVTEIPALGEYDEALDSF